MPATDCTEHLSCRLPAPLLPSHVEIVERQHVSGRVVYALMVGDDYIGAVQDSGHTTPDGHWMPDWEGFAGGAAVPFPYIVTTREEAVRFVVAHCSRAGLHNRMALHVR